MITTAEINRIQREGHYSRWAYFVDEEAKRVGVVFANAMTFAAYTVADEPDPKLHEYGVEAIKDLEWTPDPRHLVVSTGSEDNTLEARLFNDPFLVYEDEFTKEFTNEVTWDWQKFLVDRGVKRMGSVQDGRPKVGVIIGIAVVAILLLLLAAL